MINFISRKTILPKIWESKKRGTSTPVTSVMSTVGPAARVCLDLGPERPWERQKTKDRDPALSLSLFLTRLTTGTRRPRRGEDSPSDQMDDRVATESVTDRLTRIHSSLCHHVRQLDEEGRKITSREEDDD